MVDGDMLRRHWCRFYCINSAMFQYLYGIGKEYRRLSVLDTVKCCSVASNGDV